MSMLPPKTAQDRVLIADDDDSFTSFLSTLVEGDGRFEVVGVARDGSEAVELAVEHRPQIVLMDIAMPIVDGVEATRAILTLQPLTRVIAVSGIADAKLALAARLAGAVEYVQKERVDEDLIDAMLAALA